MNVSEDKCIQCDNRCRPTDLERVSPSDALDPDGTFIGLPFWFCSVECYKKALRKYMDPRYDFDKGPEDDEECCNRIREAHIDYHIKAEEGGFFGRVGWTKPDVYMKPEVDAALEAFHSKKVGEIVGAELELFKRLDAEWDHQIAKQKAVEEKEIAKLEERLAKLDQENKLREGEEQRWRPRPFDI